MDGALQTPLCGLVTWVGPASADEAGALQGFNWEGPVGHAENLGIFLKAAIND